MMAQQHQQHEQQQQGQNFIMQRLLTQQQLNMVNQSQTNMLAQQLQQ